MAFSISRYFFDSLDEVSLNIVRAMAVPNQNSCSFCVTLTEAPGFVRITIVPIRCLAIAASVPGETAEAADRRWNIANAVSAVCFISESPSSRYFASLPGR